MNLTANEKAATARQRRYVLLLAVMLVLFVYHYSTLILGGILSAYTSAGTKCIFIKIWF